MMVDEAQQADTDQPRPSDQVAVRRILVGYGNAATKMPASTLKLYKEMEKDYAVGMCLGLLSFPVIASQWSIEVKDAGGKNAASRSGYGSDETDGEKVSDTAEVAPTEHRPDTSESIQSELTDMLTPIWRDAAKHLLTAMSRKAAPAEKRFDVRDGKIWLKRLDPVALEDAELLYVETPVNGQTQRSFGGMAVKVKGASLTREQQAELYGKDGADLSALSSEQVPVPAWKTLWFAIDATCGELVGESIRMERAKRPWWSKASQGGLLDVEDIWFRQRVTDPVQVYYKEGIQTRTNRSNAEVALEIGQNYQAHGVLAIPLGEGQTPETCDFIVKTPEGQKESKQIPNQIDQSIDPRIMLSFCIAPLVGGAKQDIGAYSLGEVLVKFLLLNIEDIGDQVTQALTKWVLQPIVNWNYGDQWSVTLKIQSLAPDVVAMLREIVKGLFGGQQAGKFISLLDIGSVLQEAGLTLADDADDRIEQIKEQLANGGMGLAEQLAAVAIGRPGAPGSAGAQRPQQPPGTNGQPGTGESNGTPPAIAGRMTGPVTRSLDQRTDEAATAAESFWDAIQRDLKKKPAPATSGRN